MRKACRLFLTVAAACCVGGWRTVAAPTNARACGRCSGLHGPLDRMAGEHRSNDPLDHWSNDPLDHWSNDRLSLMCSRPRLGADSAERQSGAKRSVLRKGCPDGFWGLGQQALLRRAFWFQ